MSTPRFWVPITVVIAAVLVHAGTLEGGFVYDDHRFIELNPAIRTMDLGSYFSDPESASHSDGIQPDIYRPLRTCLFALEYALFGVEDSTGWHAVSLLLHALNSLLVYLVLLPLFRGRPLPAGLAALVFAVHPVTSESVAWVSSQGDLLAMTFMLLALLVTQRTGVSRTVLGLLFYALACLAKESALMLPGLLVLRDLALPREPTGPWPRTTWTRALLTLPVAALYFWLRLSVIPDLEQVSRPELASTYGALSGLVWYATSLLWPVGFSFDLRVDIPFSFWDPEVILGLGILGTLLAAGLWGWRSARYVLTFATIGFLVSLVPVSNVIVPLKTFMADRFLYPGLLCFAAGVSWLLCVLPGRRRAIGLALGVVLAVLLGARTVDRNRAWADEQTLWESVRADRPGNENAHQGLAFEYAKEGQIGKAERAIRSYLEANPIDGKVLMQLGDLFGRIADSLQEIKQEGVETNMRERRAQAHFAQISAYRRAMEIWETYGLRRGRGSEAMRRGMLTRWADAALQLGDVGEAKRANDMLARTEGLDPTASDFMARAPWQLRAARLQLALKALSRETHHARGEQRKKVLADRSAVLRDVGLDPRQQNRRLLPLLERQFRAFIDESVAAGRTPPPLAFVEHAKMLYDMDRKQEAVRRLEEGLRHHPDNRYIQGLLRQARGR